MFLTVHHFSKNQINRQKNYKIPNSNKNFEMIKMHLFLKIQELKKLELLKMKKLSPKLQKLQKELYDDIKRKPGEK